MPKSRLRIAAVDDNAAILEFIRSVLEDQDVVLETFLVPQEFLDRTDVASYDLILSDLMFPNSTGIDLLRAVNERTRKPRFVIMTDFASVPTAVQAMKEGAVDYLAKPFRVQELLNLVLRASEARDARSEPSKPSPGAARDFAIGNSKPWRLLLERAQRVAEKTSTVLIRGETGTGKEVLARYIGSFGPRVGKPFVTLNCATLPEHLIESELFGHVRGAFSGATNPRRGLFEEASGGTIFLDEIGTMPLPAQAKVLRALEERQVRRVGDNRSIAVDVRILAATNLDLEAAVSRRDFREDLYYRLSVVTLVLPPLRERREDIAPLVSHFLAALGEEGQVARVSSEALALLERYPFPGNVRELKHALEQALAFSRGGELSPDDFAQLVARSDMSASQSARPEVEAAESAGLTLERVREALRMSRGNRVEAAKLVGVSRSTFYRALRQMQPESPGETAGDDPGA